MRQTWNGALRYVAALASLALLLASTTLAGSGSQSSFVTLDPPGSVDTRAFGISDAGDIVGLYITSDARTRGFLLKRGVYTSIDVPGSIRTNALGVTLLKSRGAEMETRSLAIVGRYDTPDNVAHGYLLRDGTLTTIDYPGTTFTVATGINSSGHIVGRYLGADGLFHGFALIDGEFHTIDHPDGVSIHAIGINARGDLAGYYQDAAGRFHGFELVNGVYSTIDPPGSIATGGPGGIIGINSREMVGFYRVARATMPCGCDGQRGFIYKQGAYSTIDVPGAISTNVTGINSRGDLVGVYQDANGRRHGFVSFWR